MAAPNCAGRLMRRRDLLLVAGALALGPVGAAHSRAAAATAEPWPRFDHPRALPLDRLVERLQAAPALADPRRFGAVGDGRTDDGAAFAAAARSGADLVAVPPGRYRLAGDLDLPIGLVAQGGTLAVDEAARLKLGAQCLAPRGTALFDAAPGTVLLPGQIVCLSWLGASPDVADNTRAIQAALDSGAATVLVDGVFGHTYNRVGDSQTVSGWGADTGFALTPLETLISWQAKRPRVYGLTNVNDIGFCQFEHFGYDGNAARHGDRATLYRDLRRPNGRLFVGRIRQANVAVRNAKHARFVGITSRNGVRNCFFVGANAKHADSFVEIEDCVAENSDIDHALYFNGGRGRIDGFQVRGFAHNSFIVNTGQTMRRVEFAGLTRHPLAGRVEGETFGVRTLIEDRGKGHPGGAYQDLRVSVGRDLVTLDGACTLIRVRGKDARIRRVALHDVPAEVRMTLCEVSRARIDSLAIDDIVLGAGAVLEAALVVEQARVEGTVDLADARTDDGDAPATARVRRGVSLDGARVKALNLERFFCGEQAVALALGKPWLRFDGLQGECDLALLQPCAQVTTGTVERLLGLGAVELVRVSANGGRSLRAARAPSADAAAPEREAGIAVRLRGSRKPAP